MLYNAFQNFEGDVIDKVVQLNSQYYHLDLDLDKTIEEKIVLTDGDYQEQSSMHVPHIKNLYEETTIDKLTAYHIKSSRDQIQGGEFNFQRWTDPVRKDNFGKIRGNSETAYPVWLNEEKTLFVIPALEPRGIHLIVSGQLEFVRYRFRGENYK